jgi:hypothetical protein
METQKNKKNIYIKQEDLIHKTKNYKMFKSVDGNRVINQSHVNRLIKSISESYVPIPLLVNQDMYGNYEIIDGQHRLKALEELGLPVHFIIKQNLSLKDMQKLNTNSRNWSQDDFMNSYEKLGLSAYIRYKTFKEKWKFGHDECWALLNGICSKPHGTIDKFRNGELTIKNYEKAVYHAQLITDLKQHFDGYKRRSFVFAMLRMFNNKDYNHARLMNKLSYQSNKLVVCSRVEDYLAILQKIYNFKTTRENKVRFIDF